MVLGKDPVAQLGLTTFGFQANVFTNLQVVAALCSSVAGNTRRRDALTLRTLDRFVYTSLGWCKGGSCGSAWFESFWLKEKQIFYFTGGGRAICSLVPAKLAAALHRPSKPMIAWYILHWYGVRKAAAAQLGLNPSG